MKLIQKSYKLISLLLILLPAFVFAEKSTPIDLTKWFNNDAIASESKINDGSFDTGGYTFPKEQMPASGAVTFKKINFIFPSYKDSEKNNIQCKGQTITLPALKADTIYFLGASEGKSYSENFNLTYTDGTEDAVKVGLSDWCVEPVYNESSAIKSAFRYTGKEKDPVACNIWIQKVQVPHPEKTLLKMILSATPGMHIFSISLAGGTTGQPGDQKIVALPENIVSVTKDGKLILDNTFNCKGFTSKNNLQAGNFDGGGFSFPSEELKEKISSENIDFNIKS